MDRKNNNKKMFSKITILILIILLSVFFLNIGIRRQEKIECAKMLEQKNRYLHSGVWFATENQKEMCLHYGIVL